MVECFPFSHANIQSFFKNHLFLLFPVYPDYLKDFCYSKNYYIFVPNNRI